MNLTESLKADDPARYFGILRGAVSVRRHFDLLTWLQGDIQRYVPHDIMAAAWGDFERGSLRYDIASPLPGVRTGEITDGAIAPLLHQLFRRWVEFGRQPYTLDTGDAGFALDADNAADALGGPVGGALRRMRSSLVHGICDERGRHDCLYVLFSSATVHGDKHRSNIEIILPYLDTALRQVAHLPTQQRRRASDFVLGSPAASARSDEGDASPPLSPREKEIMEWVRLGKTNQEVGMILEISEFTVKNHLQRIFKKFGVYNRTHAVTRFEKQYPRQYQRNDRP
ncbi:transcriptional regulator EpsA [Rhodocyclus tenuis]|uniref:Transcriptional regulator EpsA n=2 Tax=Rhodocyclus TaxID=1064 RepID=A0A6L5JY92_RHOTE|nr:XrtB/PEP-CTERM-associated transcriptional regulator EpsA [Rhodocyclus gracilis]MQY52295.1 transcriptional regulator EpsA [Rhodocyclus gracilis]MRD73883.1 transcriptional regulator EpsA [Rhodocyclus gracilis]NJA89847.1 transcriptional regulator EpsA [Rhodocyclus gracilis]